MFLPSVPVLLGFAAELEAERDHVVWALDRDPEAELDEAQRERKTPTTSSSSGSRSSCSRRRPRSTGCCSTGASSAPRPRRAHPRRRTTSGCLACSSPTRWRCCCASGRPHSSRAVRPAAGRKAAAGRPGCGREPVPHLAPCGLPGGARRRHPDPTITPPAARRVSREQLAALRKELNGLVGAWSHRTGQPHGVIHNELRRAPAAVPPCRRRRLSRSRAYRQRSASGPCPAADQGRRWHGRKVRTRRPMPGVPMH